MGFSVFMGFVDILHNTEYWQQSLFFFFYSICPLKEKYFEEKQLSFDVVVVVVVH